MPRLQIGLLALSLLAAGSSRAETPGALTGQFQVNTYTSSAQNRPAIGIVPSGMVIVWHSMGDDTDTIHRSVQAQRFAMDGSPLGEQFLVNSYTTGLQDNPAIAVDTAGGFLVAWSSSASDFTDNDALGIHAQRFDSSGGLVGEQFQVNSYTTSTQYGAAIAIDAEGDFVIAWSSLGSYQDDNNFLSIQAQRFDSGGDPVGAQFQVNTFTTEEQSRPAVAMDPAGHFVVVWRSFASAFGDSSDTSIQGQRFDSDGNFAGAQFQVNTYTLGYQDRPAIATGGGDFVVTWESDGSGEDDADSFSIQLQRLASDGSPVGGEMQVNTHTTGAQKVPAIAVDAIGTFVVVWESDGSDQGDTSLGSIQGQFFTSTGSRVGEQFQVNTYTTGDQDEAFVAIDGSGHFVVAWESDGSAQGDTSSSSIQARLFCDGCLLFGDGFESGNTEEWTATQGAGG